MVSATDYYPFGMQMPGRTLTAANYRYGFNGKENDNEVKGDGNQIDYGFRIYDPRGGRFLSVDPLIGQYPQLTPYQYASNRPIDGIDIDGLEWGPPHGANGKIDDDAALQMMHANSEMAIGFYESGKGTIVGALSALKHPVRTINGIANAIAHPINTFNAVKNQYVQEFDDNAAKASGKIGGDIFQLLFGGEFIKGVSQNLKWSAEVSKGAKLAGFLDTKALVETVTKIFKNGKEVIEPAYKIGKYGFENTKEFKTIVNAMQSSKGTNFIVSSQEEALKFLNKAFPGIKQEATGEASKFGYRLDVEETASGSLKQGHQGTHVNYYDKENKIWGNIEIKAK